MSAQTIPEIVKKPQFCSCCGYEITDLFFVHAQEGLFCLNCFINPNIFVTCKRVLPHWTLTIKQQDRNNNYGMDHLTKKSKREYEMSCSLYLNQKTLENWEASR